MQKSKDSFEEYVYTFCAMKINSKDSSNGLDYVATRFKSTSLLGWFNYIHITTLLFDNTNHDDK